jgi:parallel beta-helix repeat protein
MKTRSLILAALALAVLSTLNLQLSTAFAQGSLTPPGAPTPTMKTLDEVKPGTPISSLPVTITNPGAYYLTKSLTTTSPTAISINTNDVSLDLMGFTLDGDGIGIYGLQINPFISTQGNRVAVRNGVIRNFVTAGVVFTFPTTNILIEDIVVQGCSQQGITSIHGVASSVIRRCVLEGNSVGLYLTSAQNNLIDSCVAIGNTQTGFLIVGTNNLVIRNLASGNPINDYNIGVSNRVGTIVLPTATTTNVTTGGPGSGTTDPFANLRY